jgi:hypothetical protein
MKQDPKPDPKYPALQTHTVELVPPVTPFVVVLASQDVHRSDGKFDQPARYVSAAQGVHTSGLEKAKKP